MNKNTMNTKVIQLNTGKETSTDMLLLEMENKAKAMRNQPTMRQRREQKQSAMYSRIMNKVNDMFDSALDVIEDPKKALMNIKPISNTMNYFFVLDEYEDENGEYVDAPVTPVVEAPPAPPAVPVTRKTEGNVVHINFNK